MSSSMTAAEYSESVRQWLVQAYQWQAITHCKLPSLALKHKIKKFPSCIKIDIDAIRTHW